MFWCILKIIFIFIFTYFSNIESIKMISGNLWTIMNFIYIFIIALTSHQFPSSVQLKKMCKSSFFSTTTRNTSITFVMNFLLQCWKIFTSRQNIHQMRSYSGRIGKTEKWKGNIAWWELVLAPIAFFWRTVVSIQWDEYPSA